MKEKNSKVAIQTLKGRLRLCWSYQGKRHWLYLGLSDTTESRLLAEQQARKIELDLISENFDQTLAKYDIRRKIKNESITLDKAFNEWFLTIKRDLTHTTVNNYIYFGRWVMSEFGSTKNVNQLTTEDIKRVFEQIKRSHNHKYGNKKIGTLKRFIEYCRKQNYCDLIWPELQTIKGSKKQPDPFTTEEVLAIKTAFAKYEPHYTLLIDFLFATGVRTGEAFALTWQNIDDNGVCWIGQNITRDGVIKCTKTGKDRFIKLPEKILSAITVARAKRDTLIFTDCEGNYLHTDKFKYVWKRVLKKAGVRYRKIYNTRHTFISHALSNGLDPLLVAQLSGNSPETIYNSYAGNIKSRTELPELF